MSGLTPNDKENLTYVECPDGTFSQQVTVKADASVDPTDVPIMQCLEDANGVAFFATYLIDPSDGSVSGGPIYTDAEGNTFVPVTPISKPVKVFDSEIKLFCDDGNNNEKYFKIIVFNEDGTVSSTSNVDLNGAIYAPIGDEILCENEQDDVRVFTQILCDAGAANKPYLACYTKNVTTDLNTLITYELDGTTIYTPVTPDVYKPKDYEIQKVWILDSDNTENGAIEKYWEASAIDTGDNVDAAPISESFTLIDECGLPLHENDPDETNLITTDGAPTTENGAQNTSHQNQMDLFLCVPRGGATLSFATLGVTNASLYLARCGAKMSLAYEVDSPGSVPPPFSTYLSGGIYQLRYYNDDVSVNGREIIRWSIAGSPLVDIPVQNIFTSQPAVTNELVRVCVADGTIEKLDGTAIAANEKIYYCNPCDGVDSGPIGVGQKEFDLVQAWTVNSTGLVNGANERYWEDNAYANTGGDSQVPNQFDLAFESLDECGLPTRAITADVNTVIATNGVESTDSVNATTDHQNIVDFFLCVPATGAEVRYNFTGNADHTVYIARCGAKLTIEGSGTTTAEDLDFNLQAGIYQVRYYVNDAGTNGRGAIQWMINGATAFTDVPVANIYTTEPKVECSYIRVCKEDGELQSSEGDVITGKVYYCDPCASVVAATTTTPVESTPTFNTEKICVVDTNTLSFNLELSGLNTNELIWTTSSVVSSNDPIYRYQVDTGIGRLFTDRSDRLNIEGCADGDYHFNYSIITRSGYVYTSFRGTHYTINNELISGITSGSISINETYDYKVREVVAVYNCDGTVKGYYDSNGVADVLGATEKYTVNCPNNTSYIPDVVTPKSETPDQCVLREVYLADGGTVGYTREWWQASAVDPGNVSIALAFTEVDECGKIDHINPSDVHPASPFPLDGASTHDIGDADIPHQARTSGFICVPAGGKRIFVNSTGVHASALYLGPCNGKEVAVYESTVPGVTEVVTLFEGIYKFTLYAHDDGSAGRSRLAWTNIDGSLNQSIPASNIFSIKPNVSKEFVWITKGETTARTVEGNQVIDLINDKVFFCDPLNGDVGDGINIVGVVSDSDKPSGSIVGSERIVLNSTTALSSSLTVPANANGAVVQVQIKDLAERVNCVRWYADTRVATATNGLLAGHKEYIALGCAASNQATITDDPLELNNFIAHIGEVSSGEICLEVIYYAF